MDSFKSIKSSFNKDTIVSKILFLFVLLIGIVIFLRIVFVLIFNTNFIFIFQNININKKNLPLHEVAEITTRNAVKVFGEW